MSEAVTNFPEMWEAVLKAYPFLNRMQEGDVMTISPGTFKEALEESFALGEAVGRQKAELGSVLNMREAFYGKN